MSKENSLLLYNLFSRLFSVDSLHFTLSLHYSAVKFCPNYSPTKFLRSLFTQFKIPLYNSTKIAFKLPGQTQQQTGKVLTGDLDSSLAQLANNLSINKAAAAQK